MENREHAIIEYAVNYFGIKTGKEFKELLSLRDRLLDIVKSNAESHADYLLKRRLKRGGCIIPRRKNIPILCADSNGLVTVQDCSLGIKQKSIIGRNSTYSHKADFIYLIQMTGTNIFKIGVTSNLKKRLSRINSVIPFNIDVVLLRRINGAFELEQSIHEKIKHRHVNNEWFKIDDINEIIKLINGKE